MANTNEKHYSLELEELFLKWRIAQMALDGNEDFLNFSAYVFTPDGLLGKEEDYCDSHNKKVLYILKESRVKLDEYQPSYFWAKGLINKKLDEVETYEERIYLHNLQAMQNLLINENEDKQADLKFAAYMNVSKNGGFDSTPNTKISRYAKHFRWFIKEQIRILEPDIIVNCCSTISSISKIISDLKVELPEWNLMVINGYHPGGINGSQKAKYLKQFKEKLFAAQQERK